LLVDDKPNVWLLNPKNFSSWNRLIRVTAWILRFRHNITSKDKNKGCLTVDELLAAEEQWWKIVQQDSYPS